MAPTPTVCLKEIATGICWFCRTSLGPDPNKFVTQGCGDFFVGRSDNSEIVLSSRVVSRNHATLRLFDSDAFVHDRGSRNGTFVNEQRVQGTWWCPLHPGDLLAVGSVVLRILWIGAGVSPLKREWLTWNDETVVKLARSIDLEESLQVFPILADALEEAGCSDPGLLGSCRQMECSDITDFLLDLILDRAFPRVVQSRPLSPPFRFPVESDNVMELPVFRPAYSACQSPPVPL